VFRPGTPCETQEPPDLNAAGGGPDQTVLANGTPVVGGVIPPLPKSAQGKPTAEQALRFEWIQEYMRLKAAGTELPSPFNLSTKSFRRELKKAGFASTERGKLFKRDDAAARAKAEADDAAVAGGAESKR
jgi:hypothetical protein